MAALALEAQHRVDHMLEHARPRDRSVLGDMADEDEGGAGFLDEADQLLGRGADLADGSRRALDEIAVHRLDRVDDQRSEAQTSELQSLMRISYAVLCLQKQKARRTTP